MHKLLWVFLILLVLSACHSPRVRRQGDESFIGMDEEELVTTIGPPDSSYEMGRERFLIYNKNGSHYYNGSYIPMSCKITFVFYKGDLDNWHFEGNMCDAYAESINLH